MTRLSQRVSSAFPCCQPPARDHVEVLASALEAGAPSAFAEYVRWLLAVQTHRPHDELDSLSESLERIFSTLSQALPDVLLAEYRQAWVTACQAPAAGLLESAAPLFLRAILRGDRRLATRVAQEAIGAGASLCEVYQEIIARALVEVGSLWQRNEISVAGEHVATAVAQSVMAQVYASQPIPRLNGYRALVTAAPGDLHGVGANMVADVLDAEGWEVSLLGSNLPGPDILREMEARQPDLVAFSVTMPNCLAGATGLISRAAAECRRVMVGGRALEPVSDEWCGALGVLPGRSLADLRRPASALLASPA